MLHESGHAAYDLGVDHRLPYTLRRWTHIFVTEAIAQFFGRMTRDPQWLKSVAAFSTEQIDPLADELRRSLAAQLMVFARWVLVMVHFERDLYADPEADLDAIWWRHAERYQRLRPPGDAAPEGAWASKIHIACAPVYYHNYLLGDLLSAQIGDAAREEHGSVLSEETGRLLTERIFHPGASLRWDAVVERATGMPLAAASFAQLMD
jgi:peptidyl-dipeptidase A